MEIHGPGDSSGSHSLLKEKNKPSVIIVQVLLNNESVSKAFPIEMEILIT